MKLQVIPPFLQALQFKQHTAVIDRFGKHSYKDLFQKSLVLSKHILGYSNLGISSLLKLPNERIAFLCQNDNNYVIGQWGSWMSGAMAVPLCKTHPKSELEYVIQDCQPSILICSEDFVDKMSQLALKYRLKLLCLTNRSRNETANSFLHLIESKPKYQIGNLPSDEMINKAWNETDWYDRNAHLVYTSGTTGSPKGVATTFSNLNSQINDINQVWQVVSNDRYLHVLPLHHVHGIVNGLNSPLSVGASVTMLPEFNPQNVWNHLLEDNYTNVFHAVPTIYAKLIEYYKKHLKGDKRKEFQIKENLSRKYRLMVSGSAALPQTILDEWRNISGHFLLERYGMTEIGMALTNPLKGKRHEGSVGKPFPSVSIQIKSNDGVVVAEGDNQKIVSYSKENVEGSLLVKGTSVFKEYWGKPEATKETFDENGWFVTGDTAMYDQGNDVIRILGRTSVDIIKTGGYKISALEIERHLLSHENVKEVVVFGVFDEFYGEMVYAMIVTNDGEEICLGDLHRFCEEKMAKYKFPRKLIFVEDIPKNAMGKVNKRQLKKDILREISP